MENLIKDVLEKKGLLIGIGAGVLRVVQCIHNGHFKPLKALMNIISASIMGYFTWEVGILLELSIFVIVIATVIASFNAFMTIEMLTNKDLIKKLVKSWFEKKINIK